MNKEQVMELMEHIDPAFIEEMECAKPKKRMPRIARAGLIAACLCAALVGTAFAVETVTGMSILRYFSAEEYNEVMENIDPMFKPTEENRVGIVLTKDELGISLDGISGEALNFAREREGVGDAADKEFDSLEAAEEFLGLNFYDNGYMDALAGEEYVGPELYDEDGNLVQIIRERGVYLLCCPDGEGMAWITMTHYITSGDGKISVVVGTEAVSPRIAGNGNESVVIYGEGTRLTEEAFVADWGGEVPIVRCDFSETELREACTMFQSYFNVYGVEYSVAVECGQDAERGAEVIKEVINAFVFKENP